MKIKNFANLNETVRYFDIFFNSSIKKDSDCMFKNNFPIQ